MTWKRTKPTILIADDEEVCQFMLEDLLESEGYELIFASGGHEALREAEAQTPDLILLDVQMQDLSGFEVCRKLRKIDRTAEIPVLMVTGLRGRENLLKMLEVGADDVIYKPYDPTELLLRIHTIVRLDRYRQLVQERSRFTWVVEESADGYLGITEGFRVSFANPAAKRLLGIKENDQRPIADILHEQGFVCLPTELFSEWPQEDGINGYLAKPEDDFAQSFWFQVEIPQLPKADAHEYIVRLHDITRDINSQQDMWSFHLIVNHKLRTPLSGLVSGTEMIASHAATFPPDRLASLAKIANDSACRLKDQIEQILTYLESCEIDGCEEFAASSVPALIDELVTDFPTFSLTVGKDGDLSDKPLRLGRARLDVILRELLSNSIKFHPTNRPGVSITLEEEANALLISISDNGAHLPQDQIDRVWMPYYQAESRLTGEIPGMGLGLSKVATYLHGINGDCRIDNNEDEPGITVHLTIPFRTSAS